MKKYRRFDHQRIAQRRWSGSARAVSCPALQFG